jgi:hypothetical protein
VSVWQTILIYVVIPGGVYGVLALLTLWSKFARSPRYRPGQQWTYEPVWWAGSPGGHVADAVLDAAHHAHDAHAQIEQARSHAETDAPVNTARGGARGNW